MSSKIDIQVKSGGGSKIVIGSRQGSKHFKKKENLDSFKQELNIDDHIIGLAELVKRYNTSLEKGLSAEVAAHLLKVYGPNALRPPKVKSVWLILLEHMFCGFSFLLWIGVVLCSVGFTVAKLRDPNTEYDQVYLGSVILAVILVTSLFGFYQEVANSSIMETFRKMIPKQANVIRDGIKMAISSEKIVLGDLIHIESGDCVPADIRIIQCASLKVDNSSITGESDPQQRSTDNTDLNPLETSNLAFYGTNVIEGDGKGIVIATGDNTLMGHIAALTSGLQAEETPIKKEIRRFIRIITIIAISIGIVFFTLSMILGYSFFDAFLYFIAIVVANVPEGLLVTMTASLTLTARKMATKNCLCKNLHAIETLGSATVICSDKTGTLTQNRMTVSHLYYDGGIVDILSERFEKIYTDALKDLCRIGILCSRATFMPDQEYVEIMNRIVNGDASETAVLKCMEILIGNTNEYRSQYQKLFEIPFNSSNKYQISIHKMPDSDLLMLVMKGAPERIIERCSKIFTNASEEAITETTKRKLKMALLELGYMGERVLGFADLILPAKYNADYPFDMEKINFPLNGLRFLGFMSMIDPPRLGVLDAVSKCKTAGIRVIMVTGDHPITAMAIAKKVGIISNDNDTVYDIAMRRNVSASKVTEEEAAHCHAAVITGSDIREMSDLEMDETIARYDEIVFARTSPQQKLQIVEAFQRAGKIVGVTGDGVNDSPALKKADIGVAMGISGSDVSKEAADMIILDDNFTSIVTGIEEGRLIFDNLKKSIAYILTSNVPEMVPFILHILANIPQALSIMAILLIDVGTDLWPAISLAYEKPEADIMKRKPRDLKVDRLVSMKLIYFANFNIGVLQAFSGLACFFYTMAEYGFLPPRLVGIRTEWNSDANDVMDSYGQEWSKFERGILEKKCVSAYFLGVVLAQIGDALISKTRRISLLQQGLSNMVMNFGLVFEMTLALCVVYIPYVNTVLRFEPIDIYTVSPALLFTVIIIIFDEMRKFFIRKRPGGWFERETYF